MEYLWSFVRHGFLVAVAGTTDDYDDAVVDYLVAVEWLKEVAVRVG